MCVNQTSGLPYTLCSRRLHTANTILPCTEDTACAYSRLQGETTHAHQVGPVWLKCWKNLCSYRFFPQALNTLGKVWLILAGGAMRLDPISPWEMPLHLPQNPNREEKVCYFFNQIKSHYRLFNNLLISFHDWLYKPTCEASAVVWDSVVGHTPSW